MSTSLLTDPHMTTEQFFAMLKSLNQFDEMEVRGVVSSLVSQTDREICFLLVYDRAVANVASLMTLTNRQHFQAISMLTRNMFELAVDINLIDLIPNSIAKMIAFSGVEKLRCAKKIVKFKTDYPTASVDDSIFSSFIAAEENKINQHMANLWPPAEQVRHWSGKKIGERVKLLGAPFNETYEVQYPQLSWHIHAGLTGVANLNADTFTAICGAANKSSTDSYEHILQSMIEEFKISIADPKIKNKLEVAKLLPFTKTTQEAKSLMQIVS